MTIRTERLELIPFTADFMRASLAGDLAGAERLLGVPLPADWPDCPRLLELRLGQLEDDPALLPWLVRAIVLRSRQIMIGHIGFHDAPGPKHLRELSPGAAEIGFEVYAPFQRQGFAREASLALINWARKSHGVTRFIVSIEPANAPSQALAKNLGFAKIGSHIDEVDGEEDILELHVSTEETASPSEKIPILPSARLRP